MIEAHGLGVKRNGGFVVRGIDLALRPGQLTVVIGPNGAGKSSLLKCLAGEWRADEGAVSLHGAPLASYTARQLAMRRAVMWQSGDAAPGLTVLELVALGRTPFGDGRTRSGEQFVLDAIAQTGLEGLAARTADTLSGGERQRADFARALCQIRGVEAPILMLDEPTASLDLKHQYHVLRSAKAEAAKGAAVFAVLHDLALVRRFADRVIALKDGRLFAEGSAKAIVSDELISALFDLPHDLAVAV